MIQSAGRLAAGMVLAGLWGSMSAQATAQGIYTCVDARNRQLTSDRPIPECLDREQKLLNPSGTVKARVGPTLTEQERLGQAAAAKKQIAQQAQLGEEQRRDRALLTRYPSQAVHEQERVQALGQIRMLIAAANQRIVAVHRQREAIDTEMEFYRKDPSKAPATLRRQVEESEKNLGAQKRFIAEQEAEIKRLTARFDEELARLQKLWLREAAASGIATAKPR